MAQNADPRLERALRQVTLLEKSIEDTSRELHFAKQEAESKAAFLAGIFEAISDVILVMDGEGKILSVNASALRLFGTQENELKGLPVTDFCFGDELSTMGHFKSLIERGALREYPAKLWAMESGFIAVKLSGSALKHQAGSSEAYVLVARNVAELERAEYDREKMRSQLANSSKMASLGEMAGGIAHEINNPLAVITGRATQLKRLLQSDPPRIGPAIEFVEVIHATAMRMAKIIKGLRSFSRNAEKDPMQPTPLLELIQDSLALCGERIKNHGIELRVNIPQEQRALECRPAQVSQVVVNLLNNAQDAIETLSEKWIELTVSYAAAATLITVTDSGKGIPPKVLDRLFMPFFTTKEVGKGTGLGLSISRVLIEEHGGTLLVDSACPNTRFVITLPAAKVIQAAA